MPAIGLPLTKRFPPWVLGVGLLALLASAPSGDAAPAPSCGSAYEYRLLDPAGDVQQTSPPAQVSGFEELDVVDLRTCNVADQIVVELQVKGAIAQSDPGVSYDALISHPNASFVLRLYYSNGSAEMEHREGQGVVNWTVHGDTLTMAIPRSLFSDISGGWTAQAQVSRNLYDGGSAADRIDYVDRNFRPPPGAAGGRFLPGVGLAEATVVLTLVASFQVSRPKSPP